MHYRAARSNEPLDRNDQWDLELLITAHDCDVIVSNDTRFMRSAAFVLFGFSKPYISLGEFLTLDPRALRP